MRRLLLILICMVMLPIGAMAEGEYPNALVVRQNDGSEHVFLLENTQLNIYDGATIEVVNDGTSHQFALTNVTGIDYEYRDPDDVLGINEISLSSTGRIEVFSLDGHLVVSSERSFKSVLSALRPGVYVIRMNGKTFKIVK